MQQYIQDHFVMHTYKKSLKRDKEHNCVVDVQGQTKYRSTFVMLIFFFREMNSVMSLFSASSIFFKKLLVNNLNHHPENIIVKWRMKVFVTLIYTEKIKPKGNQVELFVIFITKMELF